jgi:hypothetical protein
MPNCDPCPHAEKIGKLEVKTDSLIKRVDSLSEHKDRHAEATTTSHKYNKTDKEKKEKGKNND